MKNIIAELRANNQVTIRYVDRPNCLRSKEQGDLSSDKERAHLARCVQKVEDIDKILLHGCKEYEHINYTTLRVCRNNQGKMCSTSVPYDDGALFVEALPAQACLIPSQYEWFDLDAMQVSTATYKELAASKAALLDIIKKSQRAKKRERCWGKIQTIKKFTRNAKQKILEAGACVDMHSRKGTQFEITLTIPGSGVDVYDVVARYSGYIVNRIAQIIRRREAKGDKILWFFVWEHQKRGALHMHWCVTVNDSFIEGESLARQIRAKWFDLLEELSVKTHIDLFKKNGYMGTWRYTPSVWQSNIAVVRKSVAAYFSKYCSKSYETSRFNRERSERQKALHQKYPDRAKYARVISLCPSRYWGCSSRLKQLSKRYRVDVCFRVSSKSEGDFVASLISKWISDLSSESQEVKRSFKKVAPDTGFIYCSGWERKIWFDSSVMPDMVRMFKRMYANSARKVDSIGALLNMGEY